MPSIAKHVLLAASKGDVQQLYGYLLDQERTISALRQQIDLLGTGTGACPAATPGSPNLNPTPAALAAIRAALESSGSFPLDLTGLPGRSGEAQDARIPRVTSHPDPLIVSYSLYILAGTPDTIWGINRDVNPPTRFQITTTATEYADNVFRVYDEVDTTKKLAFDVGALVGTGTVRTMKVPNVNQLLAGRDVDNAFSALETFVAGLLISGGTLAFSVASGKVVPGVTQISFRDNADANDNLKITDAGNVTVRGTTTSTGALTASTTFLANQLASLLGGLQLTVRGVAGNDTLSTEPFVKVNSSGGAWTLNLPAAPSTGTFYFILDDTGNAGANNITVSGNGKNINGAATKVIATNRNGLGMFYGGVQWAAWVLAGA